MTPPVVRAAAIAAVGVVVFAVVLAMATRAARPPTRCPSFTEGPGGSVDRSGVGALAPSLTSSARPRR